MIGLFLKHYYKSILIGLAILWLSLSDEGIVNPDKFLDIQNIDKIGHFLAYLAFSAVLLLDSSWWSASRRFRYFILFVPLVFGALMEILQKLLTHGRQADIADMAADVAGIFVGVFAALIVRKFLK